MGRDKAYNRRTVKKQAERGMNGKAKNCNAIFLTPCYKTPAASGLTHLGSSKERLRGKLCLPTHKELSWIY